MLTERRPPPRPNEAFEKFVVSPELAKRLKQCGFNTPSMFFWVINDTLGSTMLYRSDSDYLGPLELRHWAPTASEIRSALPDELWISVRTRSVMRQPGTFHYLQSKGKYSVSLVVKSPDTGQMYEFYREEDKNEAEAVGRVYCYVFENGLHELRA
jgi:hypothetical protein